MGVVFLPGGARAFFQLPADAFHNEIIALDAVWGSQAAQLGQRLDEERTVARKFRVLEAALLEIARAGGDRLALHPSVQHGLREVRRVPHSRTVIELSRDTGLSRRRFGQLFREQIGMTPKMYCRLIRFRQVVRQILDGGPVNWAEVSVAGGYYDQAHLIHEFRDFSGMSPGDYLAAERPHLNHVRIG